MPKIIKYSKYNARYYTVHFSQVVHSEIKVGNASTLALSSFYLGEYLFVIVSHHK